MFAAAKAALLPEAPDSAQDSVEFQSSLCKWAGFSYLSVQPVSTTDSHLDRCELLPLKRELEPVFSHIVDINADDGYLFQHASYAYLLQILPRTSLNFPPYSASANKNTRGVTFKAKFERKTEASHPLVAPLPQWQAESHARVEALLLVDPALADLLALADIDTASLLTTALHDRVARHEHPTAPPALPAWHPVPAQPHVAPSGPARARTNAPAEIQPPPVSPSYRNKIATLHNLYVASYRLTRRRILGLVNYMHVTMHWVAGLYSLVTLSPSRLGDWSTGREPGLEDRGMLDRDRLEGMLALARLRHSFDADSDGVLHCRNQDRVAVVYEGALEELARVEDRLLRLATQAVKEHEGGGVPNGLSVLHDVLQCEAAFLEAKLRHVSLLLDAVEHACDEHALPHLLQRVHRALQLQACVDVSARFVAGDYELHIAALNRASDLLRQASLRRPTVTLRCESFCRLLASDPGLVSSLRGPCVCMVASASTRMFVAV